MGFPILFMGFVGGGVPIGFPAFMVFPDPLIGFTDDMEVIG